MRSFARRWAALAASGFLAVTTALPAYAEPEAESGKGASAEEPTQANELSEETGVAPPPAGGKGAPGPGRRPGQRRGRGFPTGMAEVRLVKEIAEEIDVSEEVLAQLDGLKEGFRKEEHRLNQELRKATAEVDSLLAQGRPDEKALLGAAAAAASIRQEMRVRQLGLGLSVRGLLTDEQLTQFMQYREKAMKQGRKQTGGRPRK